MNPDAVSDVVGHPLVDSTSSALPPISLTALSQSLGVKPDSRFECSLFHHEGPQPICFLMCKLRAVMLAAPIGCGEDGMSSIVLN